MVDHHIFCFPAYPFPMHILKRHSAVHVFCIQSLVFPCVSRFLVMQNLCIIEVALLCILLFHVNKNTSHIYPENFSAIFTIEAFLFSILLRFFLCFRFVT